MPFSAKTPAPIEREILESVVSINPEALGSGTPSIFQFLYIDISSVNYGVIDWSTVTLQTFATAPSRARRIVRPNDILLCAVRPALQAHAFFNQGTGENYICSTGFIVLRATDAIEPRYLYHLVFHPIIADQLRRLETGSNYPAVNENDVRGLHIPVPDIGEQRHIAEILDTIDTQIQETGKLIAKLKQMKAGLLHDLLTKGIDEHGEVRDPVAHPEQFKESALGLIPGEWEIYPLQKIAEIGSGVTLGQNLIGANTVELPYLRVANVQDGYLNLTEMKTVRVLKDEVHRFLLQPGDVLMTEGGDFDKLGRGTIWTGKIAPCLHQNHIFRVRTNRDYLYPDYLALVSSSPYGRHFFLLSSKQSTNLASINSTQLKAFPIPCPPKHEQELILEALNSHDTRITSEEAYLNKLRQIKRGLMHDLLTGRVRVTELAVDGEKILFP